MNKLYVEKILNMNRGFMHHSLQLRGLRLSQGLSQQDLAHSLDVSPITISELENGLLSKIISFFSITNTKPNCLFGYRKVCGLHQGYDYDQIELLEIYHSLPDFEKGMLLERALTLAEESNKTRLLNTESNVIYFDFS